MPTEQTIEAAEERIARYRQRHGVKPPAPQAAQHPLEAGLTAAKKFVECFDCHELGSWGWYPPSGDNRVRLCLDCEGKRRAEEIRTMPREAICQAAGIDRAYWVFDPEWLVKNEGGWPKDARKRPPGWSTHTWTGRGPRFCTLAGPNGNGKTTLAVELAVRCYRSWAYRHGLGSLFMIRPSDLLDEHFADEKPRTKRALHSPVTILDEAYGRLGQTEHGYGVMEDFMARRWQRRGCATILTTNRALSIKGEADGPPSIERVALAVFDRLTDGLLVHLSGPSGRGR